MCLRLFFWSERPLEDWELKLWLGPYPVDLSVFAPAQPIYVARPIFVGGPDPVPIRSGIWRGDRDAISPPEITRKKPSAVGARTSTTTPGSGGGGYEAYRARIGDHEGGEGFLNPINSAAASFIGRHGAAVKPEWLRADLERAIREAARDPAKHPDAYTDIPRILGRWGPRSARRAAL